MPCCGGLQLLYYILPTTLLTCRVCKERSCLPRCVISFTRTQNYFETLDFSSFFASSFCDILGVKHLFFSPVSFPPPPLFLLHVCLFVFSLVLVCMQFLELPSPISIFYPFELQVPLKFIHYLLQLIYPIPKSTETALRQAKMTAPIFMWANVNNVYRCPISFFVFLDRVWYT